MRGRGLEAGPQLRLSQWAHGLEGSRVRLSDLRCMDRGCRV